MSCAEILTLILSAINIIVVGWLSRMLWKTNKEQGERQIELQKNAQRISLFEKYSEIYCAYKEDMTNMDFYEQAFLLSPQQFEPMEYLNSKVTKNLNASKLLLTEKECIAIGTIGTYLNEIMPPVDFIAKNAKEKKINIDVDWGQYLFIENNSKLNKEQISEHFYAIIRKYGLANEDAINHIKNRKAKIIKIAEENNLEQVLENYCNINNILKVPVLPFLLNIESSKSF